MAMTFEEYILATMPNVEDYVGDEPGYEAALAAWVAEMNGGRAFEGDRSYTDPNTGQPMMAAGSSNEMNTGEYWANRLNNKYLAAMQDGQFEGHERMALMSFIQNHPDYGQAGYNAVRSDGTGMLLPQVRDFMERYGYRPPNLPGGGAAGNPNPTFPGGGPGGGDTGGPGGGGNPPPTTPPFTSGSGVPGWPELSNQTLTDPWNHPTFVASVPEGWTPQDWWRKTVLGETVPGPGGGSGGGPGLDDISGGWPPDSGGPGPAGMSALSSLGFSSATQPVQIPENSSWFKAGQPSMQQASNVYPDFIRQWLKKQQGGGIAPHSMLGNLGYTGA